MGHRASVAYATKKGVTVHYSHWGAGRLLDDISEETPLGSGNHEPAFVNGLIAALEGMASENDMEVEGQLTEAQETTPVEAEPYAICDSLETWARDHVDYLMHESAYYIDTTQSRWEIRAFAPMYWSESLNFDRDSEEYKQGCLVEAGELCHGLWGSIDADSFEEFLRKAASKANRSLDRNVSVDDLLY